jgi:hypothetical protein
MLIKNSFKVGIRPFEGTECAGIRFNKLTEIYHDRLCDDRKKSGASLLQSFAQFKINFL